MSRRVTITECPNCGGPLDPIALSKMDDPICPHCHEAIPVEEDPAPPAAPFNISGFVPEPAGRANRRGGVIGAVIVVVLLAVVGAAVAFGHTSSGHSVLSSISGSGYSTASSIVVPVATTSSGSDFYVIAPTIGNVEAEVLRRVNPLTDKVVWSSATLDQSDSGVPIAVAGPSQAFAIFGTNVVALDATSGRQLWRASLSATLATPCDSGCAVVVGQHLVTLAVDGTVQAFDVATGAQSWSMRLNSTPRWLEAAGNTVLTDDTGATGADRVVLALDPATGAPRKIVPTCPPTADSPLPPAAPNDEDGFFVSPDGTALTVLIADSGGCVVHYRLADGAMVWRTPSDEDNTQIPFTLTGESTAQSQTTLAWTNDDALFALDTGSGAIRQLPPIPKGTTLTLTGIIGSTLIAQSALEATSDMAKTIAIDLTTGQQRWQVATRVVKSGDTQVVEITGANPVIVSCNSDADSCLFEAVNLQTGTITGSSTVPAEPGSVDEVHAITTPTALEAVVGWEHIVGFNPTTAAVQWRWPK